MSVIFGIKEADRIIIAGDKRGTSKKGEFISDEIQKIIPINEHLCIASAGNVSISNVIIRIAKERENKDELVVEDLLEIIESFYKEIVEKKCETLYRFPFYSLIAGRGKDGDGHLYNAGKFKNRFDYKEVTMALYSPPDASNDECNRIFVKNYKLYHKEFYKKTVKEISQISNTVSNDGHCWIYDFRTQTGKISEF